MNNRHEADLEERSRYLEQMAKMARKELARAPAGTLRITSGGNRPRYYYREKPADRTGRYMREEEMKLAAALAQKDYAGRVLQAAEAELGAIRRYRRAFPSVAADDVFASLPRARQELVIPYAEPDDVFVNRWMSVVYDGKTGYGEGQAQFRTERGEMVRSKSELIIADTLLRQGVPYRYEYPVYLEGMGTVYPDFTCLNVRLRREILWEHRGLMDDPDYAEKAVRKEHAYLRNGYMPGERLLITSETLRCPLDAGQVRELIATFFL